MARQIRSKSDVGQRVKPLSITLAPDVDQLVRTLAESQNSSIAKAMDGLIREGLKSREIEARDLRLAADLDGVISRLASLPYWRPGHLCDVYAEQSVLASIISGAPAAAQIVAALDQEIFFVPVHSRIWQHLRGGDVEPGAGAAATLTALVAPQAGQVVAKSGDTGSVKTEEYVHLLAHAGRHLRHGLDRAVIAIVDSYLGRATQGAPAVRMKQLNTALYQGYVSLLEIVGSSGLSASERDAGQHTSKDQSTPGLDRFLREHAVRDAWDTHLSQVHTSPIGSRELTGIIRGIEAATGEAKAFIVETLKPEIEQLLSGNPSAQSTNR